MTKVKYTYTFPTGLVVHFTEVEKIEIDGVFRNVKLSYGDSFVWNKFNVNEPYLQAMQEYFKHND